MNNTAKIPFGLRESDLQYVDVAEVQNGKQCGCICPSCKAPLQAKQGKINKWHFAHYSKEDLDLENHDCKYTFWISVLSMAKEIVREGEILTVPSYTKFLKFDELFITDEKKVSLTKPQIDTNNFDVFCDFEKYSIGIFFSTPEKKTHPANYSKRNVGILEISLSIALTDFFSTKRNTNYKEILREIIFNNVNNKKWLRHPKIDFYKEKYGSKLLDKPPFNLAAVVGGIAQIQNEIYQCNDCKIKWRGVSICPDCNKQANKVLL